MTAPLAKKDFMSDQLIRWCPGCGDYSILAQTQTVLAEAGVSRENTVFVSGIGCSSRFPYYMNTYGFHTIHGRAPGVATGLKVARPDLDVWLVTGDGDALSIGGNHFIHILRRNVDLKLLLFDNRIYGLTKGQYSPTSEQGKKTKSSPYGSLEQPFEALSLALASGASFVARSVDVFAPHLRETLHAAHHHRGTAFVHLFQNCNIFNDGAFDGFTDKAVRDERILYLRHGEPLVWGTAVRRGLVLKGLRLEVVVLGDGLTEKDCLVHDVSSRDLAWLLANMDPHAGFPVAIGCFYQQHRETYDHAVHAQIARAREAVGSGDLQRALSSGDTWTAE